MKKLITSLLLLISLSVFSQQDNYKLLYYKDIMTDKEYVFSREKIQCFEDVKKGFIVGISWKYDKNKIIYSGLTVVSAGIGACVEKDDLIILFEDDTKISLKSWNDFNCKGRSYFDLYGTELNNLTKKIKAIRFQNGRDYSSYTFNLIKETDKTFFIDAKASLDKQTFEKVDKM